MTDLFLIVSLFFPRFTLFMCFLDGSLPANTTPPWIDVLGFFFLPNVLIAFWAYESGHPWWAVAHVIAEFLWDSGKIEGTRRRGKRKHNKRRKE